MCIGNELGAAQSRTPWITAAIRVTGGEWLQLVAKTVRYIALKPSECLSRDCRPAGDEDRQ